MWQRVFFTSPGAHVTYEGVILAMEVIHYLNELHFSNPSTLNKLSSSTAIHLTGWREGVNDPCFVSLISSVLLSPPNHPRICCRFLGFLLSVSLPLYFYFSFAHLRSFSMQLTGKLNVFYLLWPSLKSSSQCGQQSDT